MAVTTYRQWVADGSPWHPAAFIDDFAHTMRGHGYTVYTIGAVATHLNIPRPEDHAPFSHTPWPGPQPYPAVLACDIMPGGALDLASLGAQIVADKFANVPGTEWVKYINWTDAGGNCYHDRWQPEHRRTPSGDRGHIHISGRTDFVTAGTSYDPVARHQQQQEDGSMPSAADIAAAVWGSEVGRDDRRRTALQLLAEAHNASIGAASALSALVSRPDIDERALGAAIGAAIAPAIIASLPAGTLTQQQVEDAVRAVLRAGVGT